MNPPIKSRKRSSEPSRDVKKKKSELDVLKPEIVEKVKSATVKLQAYQVESVRLAKKIEFSQVYRVALMARDYFRNQQKMTVYRSDLVEEVYRTQKTTKSKEDIQALVEKLVVQYPTHFSEKKSLLGKCLISIKSVGTSDLADIPEDLEFKSPK